MEILPIKESSTKSYKRQRYLSCPAINNKDLTVKFRQKFPRVHRQSVIDEFSCMHSNYSSLKSSNSEPRYPLCLDQVGVKSFDSWRPRKNSSNGEKDVGQSIASRAACTMNEDRVLTVMNVETKRVLESSKIENSNWYNVRNGQSNPFKSDLFLRVLYLIGSENDEDEENSASIQNQFLTEGQIRENRLKEQHVNVERLKHELTSGDSHHCKSGTVTPAELIYQSIPNIMKKNSFSSSKLEQIMASHLLNSEDKKDSGKLSAEDLVDCYPEPLNLANNKDNHKLSGREKNMFAPLTF